MSQKCPTVNIFIERSLNLFEASPNTVSIILLIQYKHIYIYTY